MFKLLLNSYGISDSSAFQKNMYKCDLCIIKDKLNDDMVSNILDYTPEEYRYDLVKVLLPYVKDKLDDSYMRYQLLFRLSDEEKPEIQSLIDKYQQKDIVNELRLMVRKILKENY